MTLLLDEWAVKERLEDCKGRKGNECEDASLLESKSKQENDT